MIIFLIHFILFTASEEKACTNKHLHISAVSEHSLATVSVTSTSKVPASFEEQSPIISDYEIYDSDRKFSTSFNKDKWTFYSEVSDEVRWNQRPTHTYDSCFMLPDISSSNVRISEGKLNVLFENNNLIESKTSSSVRPLSSDIEPLVSENGGLLTTECSSVENASVLSVTEGNSAKPLNSGKQVGKLQNKSKKIKFKRTGTAVTNESVSTAISQKASPLSKKKKGLKARSKHNMSTSEVLSIVEEDAKLQKSMKDSAAKLRTSPKSKKGVKKHKTLKKDEANKDFKEVRRRGRQVSFNQSLAAYVSVCVSIFTV